jgi:probable F420-dependent oxidoreductase
MVWEESWEGGGLLNLPTRIRFGLALENFTPHPKSPDMQGIRLYAENAESLQFDSLWAWDHILLGSKRPFPFLDSLTVLGGLALCTERVVLGTGVLVLPLRNPVVLAKVTSTIDQMSSGRLALGVAAGWYEKEFTACGVPYKRRGKILERNLDVLKRFWTQTEVEGSADGMTFERAVMLPKPVRSPRPPILMGGYVDTVLKRVATESDGWLTYFYTSQGFAEAWKSILSFAEEAGRDPSELTNVAQLPICIDKSFETADRKVKEFIARYFDVAPWSNSSPDSAIRGTIDDCAEQLDGHLQAGAEHVVFVPHEYDSDQVKAIASELLPALGAREEVSTLRR